MDSHKLRALGRLMLRVRDDRGATAVEYGLMVSLIAVVIIAGVTAFGTALRVALFGMIVSALSFFA